MKTEKLKVGQKLILVEVDHRGKVLEPKEVEVSKVGNKYFELKESSYTRFHIDTMVVDSQYTYQTKCYFNIQEFNDHKETQSLNMKMRKFFDWDTKLNLDQLRRIDSIISETTHP